jgi:hypothetical protein
MDSFNDLQQLWQTRAEKPAIPAKELILRIKKQRRNMLAGLIGTILALLATIAMMVWIFIGYHPVLPTTRVSIVIMMIAVLGAIFIKTQALRLLMGTIREDVSNAAMIAALQRLQQAQRTFNTVGISVYYILLSAGMALYLAEFVRGNLWFGITAYTLTFGWIAFTWFYFRKRGIRKQNAKLDNMISHLKTLQQEWE